MDHMRFSPIQTDFAQTLLSQCKMPADVSTGVLIDAKGAHIDSDCVLRVLPHMGFPYNWLGPIALLVPAFIRDFAYYLFATNRGFIWRVVKRVTGLGDSKMEKYRGLIIGLQEPLEPGWGFDTKATTSSKKDER
jgi:predicted DCC family thiol-disulfide oxidoreductase YuxK